MAEHIAFVAGATGYTGREVVRLSVEHGVRCVAHVRPDSTQLAAWQQRFEKVGAEVDTTAWTEQAMTTRFAELQPTIVFALLGTTRARGGDYDKVDYGLTAMLVQAAAAMDHKPRLVYLSSLGVSKSEPSAKSYMHARWACEKLLHETDVPYTIARPSFITGDDRDENRPGERFGSAVANGALAIAGLFGGRKVRERYRSTSNTELADSLVRLALDPSAANATIESEDLRGRYI